MKLDLASLKRLVPRQPVTRFAPSPTGFLHLGHVASAIYVWGIGRALKARILLRIEDHDHGRCRKHFEIETLKDLAWLGFMADEGVNSTDHVSDFRQSDCPDVYRDGLENLKKRSHVYGCRCSRKTIIEQQQGAAETAGDIRYPGVCRDLNLPFDADTGVRVQIANEDLTFDDIFCGPTSQNPARQCGDVLLRDRSGNWTYQFCVVLDDLRQGVNLVVRGQDLLNSTGRQMALIQMLGGKPPVYAHHPLVTDNDGRKLGKRFFSDAIAARREAGEDPRLVLGDAAYHVGLIQTPRPIRVEDIAGLIFG